MNETATVGITGLSTVGVPVIDQDRALGFYAERLGFDVHMDEPVEQIGGRWIVVAPPGSATSIALVPANEGAAGVDTGIRLSTGNAAALHQQLQDRGVDLGDLLRWPGVPPMFTLRDPDQNSLYVVEQPTG